MSFLRDLAEAISALGQTLLEFLPESFAHVLDGADKTVEISHPYQEFKTRVELACQIQLLKKSIEDKGLLSSQDRIEVLSCACAAWALTQNAEEEFQKCKQPLNDEAEDLLYVSSFIQKENDIKAVYIKFFENAKTTSPNESLIFTKEIKKNLMDCFNDESRRKQFYQMPFKILNEIFNHLPNFKQKSMNLSGGMA